MSGTLTVAQVKDLIKTECQNFGMEEVGEKVTDQITEKFAAWEKKSEKQRIQDQARALASVNETSMFNSKVQGVKKSERTMSFGELVSHLGATKMNKERALTLAKQGDYQNVVMAMEASDYGNGGSLIPEEMSSDFIEFLHNFSVVRELGASVVKMDTGSLVIGRQNSTATAFWVGESEAITVSNPGTGELRLDAKKLGILVPVSNDFSQRVPQGYANLVLNDILAVARNAEDAALIRGKGTVHQPKGILYSVAASNKFDATSGTLTVALATNDLLKAKYKVDGANIPMLMPGWMMNPRAKYALMSLRTTEGYPVFMEELSNGTLFGDAMRQTNNIPKDLGGTGTEIYFGDFAQLVIGDTLSLDIAMSDSASYKDAAGNLVHSFAQDQNLVRLTHKIDCALRHNEAFSVIENCQWGASLDA